MAAANPPAINLQRLIYALALLAMLWLGLGEASLLLVMVHAVLWLPPTIVGGIYLLANPVKQPTNERKISDE